MTTTMKVSKFTASNSVLMEVGKLRLPRKISYAIARNLGKFEPELKIINQQVQDIARRYALLDENGEILPTKKGQLQFADREKAKNYRDEMAELDDTDISLELYTVSATELDKCDERDSIYDTITPIQEAVLSWMFDYGDAEDAVEA